MLKSCFNPKNLPMVTMCALYAMTHKKIKGPVGHQLEGSWLIRRGASPELVVAESQKNIINLMMFFNW